MADEREHLTRLVLEASTLVDRVAMDSATPEDLTALERWCAQSPRHMAAVEALMEVQSLVATDGAAARAFLRPAVPPPPVLTTRRAMFGGGTMAAGLAVYLACNPPLHLWPSASELAANVRTNRAQTKTLALGQARVEFDRATTASMNKGRLQLIDGAVMVDASSVDRLNVYSGEGVVTAQRASLNLSRLDGVNCLTCLSGRVDLVHTRSGRTLRLTPGQQAKYSAMTVDAVSQADLESTLAWRHGLMVFSETPLIDVIRQINHYRPGRVILTDASVAQKPLNGVFNIGDFDKALNGIHVVTGVKVTSLPGGIVLLG